MAKQKFNGLILFAYLLILIALLGCSPKLRADAVAVVDLTDLQPLPDQPNSAILPLRIAIGAVISPEGTAESYAPILAYLSEMTQRPVELVQRRTYAEVNDLIMTENVDLAFVCTSAYLAGRKEFGMQLLVAPVVNGETSYRSQLIVPSNSQATSIADLRGKVFVFTDPMSFTGRMYPTYLLHQLGERPEAFFERTFFSYSHDDAIRAVADGLADAAAVDSLVLDFALARDSQLADKIKVIHTSPSYGIPPVVVGPSILPHQRMVLQEIFLNMHLDAVGRAALDSMDIDFFVEVNEDLYDRIDEIMNKMAIERADG